MIAKTNKWAIDFKQFIYSTRIMDIQGENKYGDAFFNCIFSMPYT